MDDAQILALRRTCEAREDGETVITLDRGTALAMLNKLDACKREQARVDRVNERNATHIANIERENKALQADRDEVNTLREYLSQEFDRAPYLGRVEEAPGPVGYVIDMLNRRDEPAEELTGSPSLLGEIRTQLDEQHRRYVNTLDDLRLGVPRGANMGDVPQDGKRYRVFFRSQVVDWEAGPDVWVAHDNSDDGARYVGSCDGWLPEPDKCWSCDLARDVVEDTGGYCAECAGWIEGGMGPDDIERGTRVRYYGIFGEDEHRVGRTRSGARKNVNGFYVVHVDLDDGRTIFSAHLRHLAPEGAADADGSRAADALEMKSNG